MPGRKEKPSLTVARATCKVAIERHTSPLLLEYISFPRSRARCSYAFSLLRATSSRKLNRDTARKCECYDRFSAWFGEEGGEKKSIRQHRVFLSIRIEPLSELRSSLIFRETGRDLPWKPSASHWILSRNPVYKSPSKICESINRRKII